MDRRSVMRMTWHDLLFAHWCVPAAALRPHVPAALSIDEFDGAAWLGVVPFRMSGIRGEYLPPLPGTHAFVEMNVRTYVTHGGQTGVWFFSLDAASRLAVRVARTLWRLNYFDAEMACARTGEVVTYASRRVHRGAPEVELRARYRPIGAAENSRPGTLEHFLTERYCLFAGDARDKKGRVWRGDIEHAPWRLAPAEATFEANSMAAPLGVALDGAPHLRFAERVEVKAAWPVRVE